MFKLYNEISKLSKFSEAYLTEYLPFSDSMQWQIFDNGIAYQCPERCDYWFGHAIDLYEAPLQNISGDYLTDIWQKQVAPLAPNAHRQVVKWESCQLLSYPNITQEYDFGVEVAFKYSSNNPSELMEGYDVVAIELKDYDAMVDVYCATMGDDKREYLRWVANCRMENMRIGNSQFFAIWHDGIIVSIAGLLWNNGVFRYASVATHDAYRGRGYASAIIAHIRDYALAKGAKSIYIVTDLENSAAKIYMRAGFVINRYIYSIIAER